MSDTTTCTFIVCLLPRMCDNLKAKIECRMFGGEYHERTIAFTEGVPNADILRVIAKSFAEMSKDSEHRAQNP